MAVDVILCQLCLFQGLYSGHIGILSLFGHHLTYIAVKNLFQIGAWNVSTDGRAEAGVFALLAEHNAAAPLKQGLAHLVECRSDT